MPRQSEGRADPTNAERQARWRLRKAAREQQRLEILQSLANDPRLPAKARALARAALEGKPQ